LKAAVFLLSLFLLGSFPGKPGNAQEEPSPQVEVIKKERAADPASETDDGENQDTGKDSIPSKPVSWQKQLRKAREEADLSTPESRSEWRKKKNELRLEHRSELQAYRERRQEMAASQEKAAGDEIKRRKDPSYTERHKKEIAEKMKNFRVYTASRSQAANPPVREVK